MSKFKEVREMKSNTKYLRGSGKPPYVHTSKPTALKDSTIQALQSRALRCLQLISKVSINLYNER